MLILADDFTGACDAAGAFGSALSTIVVTAPPTEWPAGVEVLAVDLDARERPPAEARARAEVAARTLGSALGARVLLKIDSTLRGPIAALIDGALGGRGFSQAVVAPAFPAQGRVVVGGRLLVNGQDFGAVRDRVGEHSVVDADSSSRLRELVEAAEGHPEWLLVGSAGLARELAPAPRPFQVPHSESLLVVAGSPSPTTREQLRAIRGRVQILETPQTEMRDSGEAAEALAERARHERPTAVVLTGGATARAVVHRVRARHVQLMGELQPGIPIGRLEDGDWHGATVVTKAGGFGGPHTLLDVVRALGPSSPQRG